MFVCTILLVKSGVAMAVVQKRMGLQCLSVSKNFKSIFHKTHGPYQMVICLPRTDRRPLLTGQFLCEAGCSGKSVGVGDARDLSPSQSGSDSKISANSKAKELTRTNYDQFFNRGKKQSVF